MKTASQQITRRRIRKRGEPPKGRAPLELSLIQRLGVAMSLCADLAQLAQAVDDALVHYRSTQGIELRLEPCQPTVRSQRTPTQTLALHVGGRTVGRLAVYGNRSGDTDLIEALVPWIALAVDRVTPQLRVPDTAQRLTTMKAEFELSRRQLEVLTLLVRGLSNKEIATALCCAENTVELHVSQLFRKAGVDSRTRLIARFWSLGSTT